MNTAFEAQMRKQLGPEATAFLTALEQPYQRGFRLNPRKKTEQTPDGTLDPVPWWPVYGRYLTIDSAAGLDPLHEAGAYYIQEPSAMAPVAVLAPRPGERILDLCAAPGGKSTQIADCLQGRGLLVSNEPVASRARILSRNIERMGVSNALVVSARPEKLAPLWSGLFDGVLVDAPCSGEGMFRRHPETRQEWTPQSPEGCASRQRGILDSAAQMVRPGGRLVYSTCTFNTLENEDVIHRFLAEHPDFQAEAFALEPADVLTADCGMLHLYPHRIRGEGHFVARLVRLGDERKPGFLPGAQRLASPDRPLLEAYHAFAKGFGRLPEANARLGDTLLSVPDLPPVNGIAVLRAGVQLGALKGRVFAPDHALALALPDAQAFPHLDLTREQALRYQRGETIPCDENGYLLACYQGLSLGFGKASGGQLKNHYPKGLRRP